MIFFYCPADKRSFYLHLDLRLILVYMTVIIIILIYMYIILAMQYIVHKHNINHTLEIKFSMHE